MVSMTSPLESKNPRQHPVGMTLYIGGIVFNLRVITGSLLIAVCGNTVVCRNPEFWLFFVGTFSGLLPCRNHGDAFTFCHSCTPPFRLNCGVFRPCKGIVEFFSSFYYIKNSGVDDRCFFIWLKPSRPCKTDGG